MKLLFSLTLLVGLSVNAFADVCSERDLSSGGLDALARGLRNRGYLELTSLFINQKIDLHALSPGVTSTPLVRVFLPSRFGRKRGRLEYAQLETNDEKTRQQAEWELAKGLFALELYARFRDYPPRAGANRLRVRPQQVSEYQVERISALLADFYGVVGNLGQLNPAGLLPTDDPGTPWFKIAALIKGPPRKLYPNQHDLNKYFLSGGEQVLESAIGDRYERALMYAHWRVYAARTAGTAAVAGLAVAGASLVQPSARVAPPAPEVTMSETNACIPESQMTEVQKKAARDKLKDLLEKLEKARRKDDSSIEESERIKQQILDHRNCHPFLLMPGEALH